MGLEQGKAAQAEVNAQDARIMSEAIHLFFQILQTTSDPCHSRSSVIIARCAGGNHP